MSEKKIDPTVKSLAKRIAAETGDRPNKIIVYAEQKVAAGKYQTVIEALKEMFIEATMGVRA